MAASRFSFPLLLALAVAVVLSPSSAPLGGGIGFTAAIPMLELEEMVAALQFHGYHLFSNAIMASNLRLRLLEGPAFTIFAPADAAVFSLDMAAASADDYFRSLLYHISPVRLTLTSLRSLPSASSFPSLLDDSIHQLHHCGRDHRSVVSIDGAAVVSPGVFYGPHVAVHGLDRSLDVRQGPSPAQLDVGLAAPAPSLCQGPAPAYDTSWIHPGVSSSDSAAAPSSVGFVEKRLDSVGEYMQSPSPWGFAEERLDAVGEYRRSPSPSIRNEGEFNCAVTSTEMCGIRASTLGVVDDEGSANSGAIGGLHEDDAGYLGEKRERVFLAPVVSSPSAGQNRRRDVSDNLL